MSGIADECGTEPSGSQCISRSRRKYIRVTTHPVATYTETPTGMRNKAAYAFIPVRAVTTVPPPNNIHEETIELQTRPHQRKARWPARPKRI
jgi:hypothetical protein